MFKEMMNFTQTEVSLLRNERAPFRPALPIRAGFEEEPRSQRREPYGTAMTRVTETSSEIKLTEKDIANALEHIRILIKAKMTKVKDRRALLKLQSSLAAVGQFLTLSEKVTNLLFDSYSLKYIKAKKARTAKRSFNPKIFFLTLMRALSFAPLNHFLTT